MHEDISMLPGVKHKVIGLVSGGKDSCFNLMHCVANGHELVALANLTPAPGTDELDSHLYQSVGTHMLPLIAEAMDLPVYTRVIKGKAVARGAEYGDRQNGGLSQGTEEDETEDLTALLRVVMEAHPEATALASGAILSNYQRLRIEHVCSRLGLVSLAYLWQQAQIPLLESMFRAGVEAVIVKVAGAGLGTEILGKTVLDAMPLLRRLERIYGSHPAGEGGEYETLTLETPLFRKRLKLDSTRVVITDPGTDPVAYLKIDEAVLVDKLEWHQPSVLDLRSLLSLNDNADGLDDLSREMMLDLGDNDTPGRAPDSRLPSSGSKESTSCRQEGVRLSRQGRWFAAAVDGVQNDGEDAGEELRDCFLRLSQKLAESELSLALHTAHVTLFISSMNLFQSLNAIYSTFFGVSPPSRATVAVPLPVGQRIKLEIVGFNSTPIDEGGECGGRQSLHVQSLSYWAPANIGPYSQAIIVNSRLHISGQIPLIPGFMTPPPPPQPRQSPYVHQAVLALQHVHRVIEVLRSPQSTGGGWTGYLESCTAWWVQNEGNGEEGPEIIRRAWDLWREERGYDPIPTLFLRAKELPRGALVEFQVNLHTGRTDRTCPDLLNAEDGLDDDEEELWQTCDIWDSEDQTVSTISCEVGKSSTGIRKAYRACIAFDAHGSDFYLPESIRKRVGAATAVRLYHLASCAEAIVAAACDIVKAAAPQGTSQTPPCITCVPVLDIRDHDGRRRSIALDVFR